MSKLNVYAKSLVAALIAGLGSLQVALTDGKVTPIEGVQIAATVLASLGLVWGVPNAVPVVPVVPAPPVVAPAPAPQPPPVV